MARMSEDPWWKADKGKVASAVFAQVKRIEGAQSDVFDRFDKLEGLYDPNSPDSPETADANVTENAIASNIDTVSAVVAATEIGARFETDGGDWDQQRRARHMEWYAEEQTIKLDVMPKCRNAFKEAAKKGNGLVKVVEQDGAPSVRQVFVENVIVDQNECRDGRTPLHMHEWVTEDADVLSARYPKFKDEITKARKNGNYPRFVGRNAMGPNDVMYLDSYRLPIGQPDAKGRYLIPGRHTITLDGSVDILDDKWEKPYFPYACMVWSERAKSWYGISGAERIMGIQRALNKRNWVIEMGNDHAAMPLVGVRPSDAQLAIKSQRVGGVAVVRGDWPQVVQFPAVSGETYNSRKDLRQSANEEFGQTTMATHGAKPVGIDSGVGLREYKDQTSQRFSLQDEAFEAFVLETIWLVLCVCKDLGDKAPVAMRHSRFGSRRLRWKDVDMGDVKVQIKAASNMSRTPAGREQFVMELAQAGIISTDSTIRMLGHPDAEAELSLYTAALETIEFCLDEIADGGIVMPEPFFHLKMCVWRAQREYNKWIVSRAPEARLEALRQFIVQAAWMDKMQEAANQNAGAGMGAPGVAAGGPPMPGPGGGPMPALAGGAVPTDITAAPAFAPSAPVSAPAPAAA
jgi:hypothetical protein